MTMTDERRSAKDIIRRCALGAVCGAAVMAVLLFIGAALISGETLGTDMEDALALASLILGALAAGMIASGGRRRDHLLVRSICAGIILFVLMLVLCLAVPGEGSSASLWGRGFICAICSAASGVLKTYKSTKSVHRARRRYNKK